MTDGIYPGMSRADFTKERMTGIGGSDAGAICGVNPYKTQYEVWLEKRGLTQSQDESEAMRWGLILEKPILKEYERISGNKARPHDALVRHPQYEYMIAHVDGIIVSPDGSKVEGILEIKTAGEFAKKDWGMPGTDIIPESYNLQVQHYMAVLGLPYADVAALIGGRDFRIYHILRNELIINYLIQREGEFWELVKNGTPPPIDDSESAKNHLAAIYPKDIVERIPPTPEISDAVEMLLRQKDAKKAIEKAITGLENEVKAHMGEAGMMLTDAWKVTWKKNKDTAKVDWQQVAATFNPSKELIEKYTELKIGPRVFIAKPINTEEE